MRRLLNVLLATLTLLTGYAASAQGTLVPPGIIQVGSTVSGTLTSEMPAAWWEFQAFEGQVLRAQMLTEGGLIPRLGVMDASGEMLARSDQPGSGVTSAPDLAMIEFTASTSGALRLVTGAVDGTVGSYRLTLQSLDNPNDVSALTVTFQCNGQEAIVLAGVQFRHEAGMSGELRAFVYGESGMHPVIRVQAPEADIDLCWDDSSGAAGDQALLPGGDVISISADTLAQASLFTISALSPLGEVTLTLGAVQPAQGRYLAFFSGESLDARDQQVIWRARQGPLPAQQSEMLIYMIGSGANSRLDPYLELGDEIGTHLFTCDDAGGRRCENLPSAQQVGVLLSTGETAIGDRFDAGVALPAGETAWHTLTFGSFGGNTTGPFVILLMGSLAGNEDGGEG
ncbi:MAG: hypothetical protein IAE89_08145 [Anaerolineae bacterium]|nr:hypothetical protein [Anaerolineae bacterium]